MNCPEPPLELAGAGRLAVGSADSLGELRRDVFRSVGPRFGHGILYGIGFTEGLIDALNVVQPFHDPTCAGGSRLAGPALPLLFEPSVGRLEGCFSGAIENSIEATLHAQDFPPTRDAICFVTAGYAAGWYTELLDTPVLVREISCRGRGDACCRFEARRLDAWVENGDAAIAELLPYLDIDALRARARSALPSRQDAPNPDDDETCATFDPTSPAVHVWGPMMILPYSGAVDCSEAIDTIVGDVGFGQVRVVIVDLLGMRLDSIEAAGLTRVLAYARAHQMESILVGLSSNEGTRLGVPVSSTLCVPDMAEGIALGFQMIEPFES